MARPRRRHSRIRSAGPAQKLHSKEREASSRKQESRVIIGPLTIDKHRHIIQIEGRCLHLTPKELALLYALAAFPGKVYRREELLKQVWGEGVYVAVRTVDVHMSKIRHKLRMSEGGLSLAETVWGVGYRLRDPSS